MTRKTITTHRTFVLAIFLSLTIFGCASVFGSGGNGGSHTDNSPDQTLKSNGRVNPATLALEMSIPLGSYPGRGISVPVSINYSSKVWRQDFQGAEPRPNNSGSCISIHRPEFGELSASGWTSSMGIAYVEYTGLDNRFNGNGFALNDGLCPALNPGLTHSSTFTSSGYYVNGVDSNGYLTPTPYNVSTSFPLNTYLNGYVKRIQIHLSGGESHVLRAVDSPIVMDANANPSEIDMNGTYYAVDGSRLRYEQYGSTKRLFFPDGSFYDFASSTESLNDKTIRKATKYSDVNGNQLTYNDATTNYPNGYWKDTLDRTIPVPIPLEEPTTAGIVDYDMPSFDGTTMTYKFHWKKLKDTTAAESALTDFNEPLRHLGDRQGPPPTQQAARPSNEALFRSDIDDWAVSTDTTPMFNPVVLAAVELPDGRKYQFSYNIYGEIEHIEYPTGSIEDVQYDEVESISSFHAGEYHRPQEEANRGISQRQIKKNIYATPITSTYSTEAIVENGIHKLKVTTNAPDGSKAEQILLKGKQPCSGCNYGDWGSQMFLPEWFQKPVRMEQPDS